MGWYGGEWIEGRTCEDAPCCGCCGQGVASSSYEDDDPYFRDRDDYGMYDDVDEDEDEDGDTEYWQAEDSALESSLFGDC